MYTTEQEFYKYYLYKKKKRKKKKKKRRQDMENGWKKYYAWKNHGIWKIMEFWHEIFLMSVPLKFFLLASLTQLPAFLKFQEHE